MTSRSEHTHSANSSLWLCLHFEQLPLEVFSRGAENEAMPIVVTEGGRVCSLNEAAEGIGIEIGSTMNTALSVSESLASFERDTDKERINLERLAQWAYQLTPNVSVLLPDSLLIEAHSCLKLWGGIDSLLTKINEGLARLGFSPTIGQGRTPLAAHLAAVTRFSDAGHIADADSIGRLPVSNLAVDAATIDALDRMGVRTIGRLLKLPTSSLSRRFGVYFTDYLTRLTGESADPRKFITPEPHFFSEITFLADVTDLNALVFPIRRLLSELGDFLTGRQLYASHLSWKLSHRSHSPVTFSVSIAEPERDPAIFMPLTQLHLDRLPEIAEVDGLSLTVREFFTASSKAGDVSNADPFSGDLFHGTRFRQRDGQVSSTADRARANALLNALSARLGQDGCFGLSQADDHRPEKAWTTVSASTLGRRTRQQSGFIEHNPRPAFLLTTARKLRTIDGVPAIGRSRLALMRGPERIDFGWWDRAGINQPAARDYYVARDRDGALFWVFEYPVGSESSHWYLHGIFS